MIYLDHAATTPMAEQVAESMRPYYAKEYANASSIYEFGDRSREAAEHARSAIAHSLHAHTREIYFTAGGSESDNWALKGTAEACREKGRHLITTQIEHHAVLNTCRYLEKQGYEVTYLPVDGQGFVDVRQLEAAIRPDTVLISVMFANNEIGTVEPIAQIGRIARRYGVLFHTDAVQAYAQVPIDVNFYHIDLLSASGHKFYGPKGTGFLYIRDGVPTASFIHGGGQEQGKRAGTENIPGIVGIGTAAELAVKKMSERMYRETRLRDFMIHEIQNRIPDAWLNGDRYARLPNNVNFSFAGIEGETLLLLLDAKDICASAASACSAGSAEPSHVLTAIGRDRELAAGSLRMTLGEATTWEEARAAVDAVVENVKLLRDVAQM
ncbi:MAG: cysteine desulfurase [Eubacterium sp.]|nr:cysteine desulfurase [Eubacterium sp.]